MEAIVALANLAENPETHEAAFGGIKKVQDFFIQKASQTGGTTG